MKQNKDTTVVVGMSGGVDSSVAALLLKQKGYKVVGMFMKCWDEMLEDGSCSSEQDLEDVAQVCETLNIPYYPINFVKEYKEHVFQDFLEEFKKGNTPNPDILCNREIKFKLFLEKAKSIGADFLATGHYCQKGSLDGKHSLLKGLDPNKDQSYFLYTIGQKELENVLFPIGHLHKSDVRKIAQEHNLVTSQKKDSTGICFIGKRKFQSFLSQYIPAQKGDFQTLDGTVVGEHSGSVYYTIGQRKGLGLGGEGDAWFVIDKDVEKNVVFVERGHDHPMLYKTELNAKEVSFVSSIEKKEPFHCHAKIRYRQQEEPCIVTPKSDNTLHIRFERAQRAITKGQSIVFYQQEECLGGAIIF